MFSFGWGEILLILVVIIIVVGPKDIPKFLRQIGNLSKSIKIKDFNSTNILIKGSRGLGLEKLILD